MIIVKGFGDADLVVVKGFGVRYLPSRYTDQEPIVVVANEPGSPILTLSSLSMFPSLVKLVDSDLVYIIDASELQLPDVVISSLAEGGTILSADVLNIIDLTLSSFLPDARIVATNKNAAALYVRDLATIFDNISASVPSPTVVQGASND